MKRAWQTKTHPAPVQFCQALQQMCIAQFMLVLHSCTYNEDDTPSLLDFVKEATHTLEAKDDIVGQGQEIEPTFPLNIKSNHMRGK